MAIVASILTGGSNNHQTTSEEANAVYTDFVSEGIVGSVGNTSGVAPATGGFAVNAQGTPAMAVDVSAGVAYVTGTPSSQNSQTFRVKNSATTSATISANSSGSTKYDWVYIKLDATKLNTPNTAGDDVATIVTSRSSSASSDDGTPPTYGYPLAVVTVANGASTITNGNIRDIRTRVALNTGTNNAVDGWNALQGITTLTTSSGYNKGQKEYDLTSSTDMTAVLSPGMRLKVTRGVTPPTQCTNLARASSQYFSKSSPSGLSFTDDFTCEAWVKLSSYGSSGGIIARRNADTEGWSFAINSSGQIEIASLRIASNNRVVVSNQSIPLDIWVHVAATMDNSGTTYTTYINGVSVPNTATTTGTITALVQGTTALVLGARKSAGTDPFDGEIADARVWSAIRTATQIRDNMNQQLVGNETNLVAYFKLDGNANDSTSNANNLSANGGAAATTTDNPMNATEYAIVTKVTASTITVFTGTDYNIPSVTLSSPYYALVKTPFGFPASRDKWRINYKKTTTTSASVSSGVWTQLGTSQVPVPTGPWVAYVSAAPLATATSGQTSTRMTLSTSSSSETINEFSALASMNAATLVSSTLSRVHTIRVSSQTIYYVLFKGEGTGSISLYDAGSDAPVSVYLESGYI